MTCLDEGTLRKPMAASRLERDRSTPALCRGRSCTEEAEGGDQARHRSGSRDSRAGGLRARVASAAATLRWRCVQGGEREPQPLLTFGNLYAVCRTAGLHRILLPSKMDRKEGQSMLS